MIESRAIEASPAFGAVTALAIRAEFPLVDVFMAGLAGIESQPDKLRKESLCRRPGPGITRLRMAFGAIDLNVFAGQTELRPVVVEFRRRFPGALIVAGETVPVQLAAMLVEMA